MKKILYINIRYSIIFLGKEMVAVSNSNNLSFSKQLNYDDLSFLNTNNEDVSIFTSDSENIDENVELLKEQLNAVESENGAILDGWNNFKEKIGIGSSSQKCDEAINQYQNGEISFEEASEIIDNFDKKQDNSLNLFSNIATSIAAIAAVAVVTVATGGTALPIIAAVGIGAATGAVTKAGFKTADRATNEIEGDALDGKQIAKDAISGAVVGGTAAATMGTAGGTSGVTDAAVGCAKTGAKTGAVSGASNYLIDCAFEEDQDFNAKELVVSTGEGAIIGAAVGGIMGSVNGALRVNGILSSGCNIQSMISSTENASLKNVAANSACSASYKILNDRITSTVAA